MVILFLVSNAFAGAFVSSKAAVQTVGASCEKKAHVEVTESMILVECKRSGYARKLSELKDLTWTFARGRGTLRAREVDGADFLVTVPKKEFPLLKAALLTNLEPAAAPPKEE